MSTERVLAHFRAEILRWNESINLVSRVGTEKRLDALITQCTRTLEAWRRSPGPLGLEVAGRDVLYLDLGSGGGLPAVMWHEQLAPVAGTLRSVFVEPREKRAWFLERMARSMSAPAPEIQAHRWGEMAAPGASSPDLVVVSLKALLLSESTLLAGLPPFLAPEGAPEVAIARFHPRNQTWEDDRVASLGIAAAGSCLTGEGWRAEAVASGIVESEEASLVVSRYRFDLC